MYCLRCKRSTDTNDVMLHMSKNNKKMKRGTCASCGGMKTQFVGKGIVNSVINKLPLELHLPGHSFTGPGTRLDKRLMADGRTPHDWSKPINRVDQAAYKHDLCYRDNKSTSVRNSVCDKKMLDDLKRIMNPSGRENLERGIVRKIIGTKKRFGLGYMEDEEKKKRLQMNYINQ